MKLILCCALLSGLLAADTVTLSNGDRITGKIVKKDGDKVVIKSDLMGEVTVAWSKVATLKSDEPLTVGLPADKVASGPVVVDAGTLQVGSERVPVAQVTVMRDASEQKAFERMLHPGFLELWTGALDLGLSTARGNAKTSTFSTAFNAVRASRTDKITLHFNQIYASATVNNVSASTAEALRGGIGYERKVHERLFVNLFNDYEYDKFQNLDLRFVAGGGLGYSVKKTDSTHLDLQAGAAFNHESFSTPLTRSSAEGYFGDDFTRKVSSRTSLHQSFRMFNNLSNTGEYRMDFDAGVVSALWKSVSWQATAADHFLSNPVVGRQKNDLLLTAGFRFTFAK